MQALTDALTVPVTRVGDRVLVGFSSREYEEAFENYQAGS
ncbi:Hypothetical protein DEACI_1379 [Acididesulfobacillus acetoxydans]|uniref:Uncharacterized protein n=1 Tax=Acididesulfobacillus acetoxydans TaxID=1561005 RepID=A0A8S0XB36_9FIRM|nr:hypothetical protein CEB3_c35560 [Peptococcaceae bacterium CEB3]CAA7600726.1 Hypothetical protein DEACI_1379 [Acididesulfobacillus acetoxydans]CEJ06165.1 Hypothetical protein DEACI_0611 [Acididesulfobacillus acetoxydans]